MRIAILADIHGNLTALDAVRRDIRNQSPDLVICAGDIADGGSSPDGAVDAVRDLAQVIVRGNTDEMVTRPASLDAFAASRPHMQAIVPAIHAIGAATRAVLGPGRLAWLASLPAEYTTDALAVFHASPATPWVGPAASASDDELLATFPVSRRLTVYGHIHVPFVRTLGARTIANTGSAGRPFDGDPRASYLLVTDGVPATRRVAYDVAAEIRAMEHHGRPHVAWVTAMLRAAAPTPLPQP